MDEVNSELEQAFRTLLTALHPERAEITQALSDGITMVHIRSLYPFDFEAYIPELQRLLRTPAAMPTVRGAGPEIVCTLSAASIEVAGFGLSEADLNVLEDPYEPEAMVALHMSTYYAYLNNNFPLPKPPKYRKKRTREEQAGADVDNLLRNLFYSAWLIANWHAMTVQKAQWHSAAMGEKVRADLAEEAQRIFKYHWQPLLALGAGAA